MNPIEKRESLTEGQSCDPLTFGKEWGREWMMGAVEEQHEHKSRGKCILEG